MGKFASKQKNILLRIIHETAQSISLYAKDPERDFTRKSPLCADTLLKLLVGMGGQSVNKELYSRFKPSDTRVTGSAFVQQRAKLLPEAFEYILNEYNFYSHDSKTYRGYHILAVDGTVMTYNGYEGDSTWMPNSGNGCNQFHVNALFDILNHTYADVLIQPNPKQNEQKACRQMMERQSLCGKTILLADRGYGGMNLIEHLNRIKNCDYLIRIKDNLRKEMRNLPMAAFDQDITMQIRTTQRNVDRDAYATGEAKWIAGHGKFVKLKSPTWDFESPYELKVRIVRFEIGNGQYETIATSLPRREFPPSELKKLYHWRWGIETSFCQLKYAVGVTNFHARKAESVMQEIYARIIMFNFCMRITVSVAIRQDNNRKWTYRVNYSMGIYICRDYFRQNTGPPIDPEIEISRYILPVRPNRADRRKVKPKPAVCFLYRVA